MHESWFIQACLENLIDLENGYKGTFHNGARSGLLNGQMARGGVIVHNLTCCKAIVDTR